MGILPSLLNIYTPCFPMARRWQMPPGSWNASLPPPVLNLTSVKAYSAPSHLFPKNLPLWILLLTPYFVFTPSIFLGS